MSNRDLFANFNMFHVCFARSNAAVTLHGKATLHRLTQAFRPILWCVDRKENRWLHMHFLILEWYLGESLCSQQSGRGAAPHHPIFPPPCSKHMMDDSVNVYLCLWVDGFIGEGDLRCAACLCCVREISTISRHSTVEILSRYRGWRVDIWSRTRLDLDPPPSRSGRDLD